MNSFIPTLPTHSCGVSYTDLISTPNTVKHSKLIGTHIQSMLYHIGTALISTSLNC